MYEPKHLDKEVLSIIKDTKNIAVTASSALSSQVAQFQASLKRYTELSQRLIDTKIEYMDLVSKVSAPTAMGSYNLRGVEKAPESIDMEVKETYKRCKELKDSLETLESSVTTCASFLKRDYKDVNQQFAKVLASTDELDTYLETLFAQKI